MKLVTRAEAVTLDLPRYFTGKPCKSGHLSERRTKHRSCIACLSGHAKRWYRARYVAGSTFVEKRKAAAAKWKSTHPDNNRANSAKWARNNPDKVKAALKRWRENNPDKVKAGSKRAMRARTPEQQAAAYVRWLAKNPERAKDVMTASKNNYRTRKKGNSGKATPDDIAKLRTAHKGRCAACNVRSKKLQVDHVVPVIRGGSNDPSNLQLLCGTCNKSKGAKDAIEWAQLQGRLL